MEYFLKAENNENLPYMDPIDPIKPNQSSDTEFVVWRRKAMPYVPFKELFFSRQISWFGLVGSTLPWIHV